jgi:hypothetical protein
MAQSDQPGNRPNEVRGTWLRALLYLCIVGGGWLLLLPLAILTLERRRPPIALRRRARRALCWG